ncbi:hypothetical protein ABWJ92_34185 [Streptomyces sp. NPDC000609]|uniref:hypothetical protein n=1 Tax=Streptomyces sp. NPDC000609 TaxID=3160957 RepID=UPI00339AF417
MFFRMEESWYVWWGWPVRGGYGGGGGAADRADGAGEETFRVLVPDQMMFAATVDAVEDEEFGRGRKDKSRAYLRRRGIRCTIPR